MESMKVRKPGFSLIELVIVVVIIAVIAAVAIPRVSRGSSGVSETALRANLKALRTAIDMYRAEHDNYPAQDKKMKTFLNQMTKKTNYAGKKGNVAGEHIFGPYLRNIPPVPVGNNTGATKIKFNHDGDVFTDGKDSDIGWVYNRDIGVIYANSDSLDDVGVAFNTY